jgi:pyruvate dehydrogenase E1 component
LADTQGPIVVSTDYVKAYGDQIRAFVPAGRIFKVLGTDGFGRSDFRYKLREHFEVDRHFVVLAALRGLADEGKIPLSTVAQAIAKYGINPNKANPHHA